MKTTKRNIVLGVLFFLPVAFLLFLIPAKHHYTPLDIINKNVIELEGFTFGTEEKVSLKNHITVLGFLGHNPDANLVAMSNLKELVYDKFKGFKKFQIVIVAPTGTEAAVAALKNKINTYESLKFWYYGFATPNKIKNLYSSLKTEAPINSDLASTQIVIIDKDLHQRGRIDDREKREISDNKPTKSLSSYNSVEVAEIKNKMSEDIRILFTEYREKRKGDFDSTTRRASQIQIDNE